MHRGVPLISNATANYAIRTETYLTMKSSSFSMQVEVALHPMKQVFIIWVDKCITHTGHLELRYSAVVRKLNQTETAVDISIHYWNAHA